MSHETEVENYEFFDFNWNILKFMLNTVSYIDLQVSVLLSMWPIDHGQRIFHTFKLWP